MSQLGRLLRDARRERGLHLPALAALLGYRNAAKGARQLAALEEDGRDPADLLPKLVAALGLDPSQLGEAVEQDQRAAIDALQRELRQPFAPRIVIRWIPAMYGEELLPERLATDSEREAWACARARELRSRVCLRLSRRHSVWIDETGTVTNRTETTIDNPRNAPTSALPWNIR